MHFTDKWQLEERHHIQDARFVVYSISYVDYVEGCGHFRETEIDDAHHELRTYIMFNIFNYFLIKYRKLNYRNYLSGKVCGVIIMLELKLKSTSPIEDILSL